MSKMKWKLMLFGVVVACAFGGIALRFAWATPSQGIFATLIAGPVALDEVDIKVHNGTESLKLKTKGDWECRVVEFRVPPGGNNTFGWHSHPGPKFVMITAGALTKYEADGTSAVYPAGTGFVDGPGDVHTGGNEGNDILELTAFFLIPLGEAVRIDEPAPSSEEDEDHDHEGDDHDDGHGQHRSDR